MLQADVVELLQQMELFEIFTDNSLETAYKNIQREITGYNAQPTFIILDGKHRREVARASFTNSADTFKEFLKKGLTNRPAFQSRLRIGKLVPLDGQYDHPLELEEAGTLDAPVGTAIQYLGEEAMAYRGEFQGTQSLQLPSDLEPGKYRLDIKLETSVYKGDEWLNSLSLGARLPLTVE